MKKELAKLQEEINKVYEEEGLTDKVLEMQVELNRLRNQLDIPDETEYIYEDFVQ